MHASTRFVGVTSLILVTWLSATTVDAASPTAVTPDGAQTLVSKDLAGQRWAITRNAATGSVSGNVFEPGAAEPRFVWCKQTDVTEDDVSLECYGTTACTQSACADSWLFVSAVTLPLSFFGAADGSSAAATEAAPTLLAGPTGSGTTLTPDHRTILVSKDVGGLRWAIGRDVTNGTITGNVFDPKGGDPRFIWCSETGSSAAGIAVDCYAAPSCTGSGCAGDWAFVSAVDLPRSFFSAGSYDPPPRCALLRTPPLFLEFRGGGKKTLDAFELPAGIYKITVRTSGYFQLFYSTNRAAVFNLSSGAALGAETVFVSHGGSYTFRTDNVSTSWKLTFESIDLTRPAPISDLATVTAFVPKVLGPYVFDRSSYELTAYTDGYFQLFPIDPSTGHEGLSIFNLFDGSYGSSTLYEPECNVMLFRTDNISAQWSLGVAPR
ncbi:hypothetical protein K2Z84_30770 [Candidatus Binatia bacterium]|nr:hypothetical protein [Candidatus Binatia bacterium]